MDVGANATCADGVRRENLAADPLLFTLAKHPQDFDWLVGGFAASDGRRKVEREWRGPTSRHTTSGTTPGKRRARSRVLASCSRSFSGSSSRRPCWTLDAG